MLDLGCGDGSLAVRLAARGYSVTGVERPGGCAKPFPESVELVEADLDAGLPAFGRRFDYVLCGDVLEHLKDPLQMLRDVRACLAPGGLLLASLPNSGNIYFRLNILVGRFPQHDKGLFDRTHLHFYTWDGWRGLFAEAGFQIETVHPTAIPIGLAFRPWQHTFPVRSAEALSYGMARLWKRLFAYQFVVAARGPKSPQ